MNLSRHGRELYQLEITTEPAVTSGWEASFDGGDTWVAGEAATLADATPVTRWLIAGPDAPAAGGGITVHATLAGDVVPLVRAIETPEVIARSAPSILIT